MVLCSVFVIATTFLGPPSSAAAVPLSSAEGEVLASVTVPGYDNPPNADKAEGGYKNPCLGEVDFESHVSRSTGFVMDTVESVAFEVNGEAITSEVSSNPTGLGFHASFDPSFEVEFVQWITACAPSTESVQLAFQPGSVRRYWIRRPTPGAIVPGLYAELVAGLEAPTAVWPHADPEFDWVYVTVDNDLRIEPVEPDDIDITIGNLVGSVYVQLTATPSHITFNPGEPGSPGVPCTYEQATAPSSMDFSSSCVYTYANSSSIGTEVANHFVTTTTMYWDVTANVPLTYSDPESWRRETIQVAAVQSLEIGIPG